MAEGARLRGALAQNHEDELVALTRDLVRIPSLVKAGGPDGNEVAVAAFVERWCTKEGFDEHGEVRELIDAAKIYTASSLSYLKG